MKRILIGPLALAVLAAAFLPLPSLAAKNPVASAQVATGEAHHQVSRRGQTVRRKRARRGAIGAGGAGLYRIKARRHGQKRRLIKKKRPVWDDTDIVN